MFLRRQIEISRIEISVFINQKHKRWKKKLGNGVRLVKIQKKKNDLNKCIKYYDTVAHVTGFHWTSTIYRARPEQSDCDHADTENYKRTDHFDGIVYLGITVTII